MLKRSKLPIFVLIGVVLSSCSGSRAWVAKKDQASVNAYVESRIDAGKYDLQGFCDRVREAEFMAAERPSNVTDAAAARKARLAYEQISQKRGNEAKCPEITANELRVHLYRAERMKEDRKRAFQALGKAAGAGVSAAMGGGGSSTTTNSSYNERLEELERKEREEKMRRDANCSNAMWRKGYC
jgi:hypothetical protein